MDKFDLFSKAASVRKRHGIDNDSPLDILTLTHQIQNLTVVLYPMGKKISGACLTNGKSYVIAINSSMSKGRQRFTLGHELYHLFYDEDLKSVVCPATMEEKGAIEKKADAFASYLLIPPQSLNHKVEEIVKEKKSLSVQDVVRLEQYYGVSRACMLHRLIDDGVLSDDQANEMYGNAKQTANELGYPIDLYQPADEKTNRNTYGYYITKAKELLDTDKISNGSYEGLLLDAFRSDIVYGAEQEGGDLID